MNSNRAKQPFSSTVGKKCSAAWQGARGERLTVGIMLPGRQDADDWRTSCHRRRTFGLPLQLGAEISEQVFSKERRRLQAKHLWMVVKLQYGGGCLLTECTSKPSRQCCQSPPLPHWNLQRPGCVGAKDAL